MCAYNLFRRRDQREVVCAVPEDRVVPSFVQASAWEFSGTVAWLQPAPAGFDPKTAAAAVRFNGFYVFQTI